MTESHNDMRRGFQRILHFFTVLVLLLFFAGSASALWLNASTPFKYSSGADFDFQVGTDGTTTFYNTLQFQGNTLQNPGSITSFFGSACGSSEAVQDIGDDGSYTCVPIGAGTSAGVYVNESGDTMTGALNMSGNAVWNLGSGFTNITNTGDVEVGGIVDMGSNDVQDLANLYSDDSSTNFFSGGCSDNQHITGIGSGGAISCGSDSGDISDVSADGGLSGGGSSGSVGLNVNPGIGVNVTSGKVMVDFGDANDLDADGDISDFGDAADLNSAGTLNDFSAANDLDSNGDIVAGRIDFSGNAYIDEGTAQYGSIRVSGGQEGGYAGVNIQDSEDYVFMTSGDVVGVYDDTDNDWVWRRDDSQAEFDVGGDATKLNLPTYSGNPSNRETGAMWYDTSAD